MQQVLNLAEWGLATWRVSRMLVKEQGPYHVFARMRTHTGIEYNADGTVFSFPDWNPLTCVLCTSLYVAAGARVLPRWSRAVLAASAIATLLELVVKENGE